MLEREFANITLIGFMGAGKSSVGKKLACALEWEFIDTDAAIQDVMGISIPEIFERYGEKRFRSEEKYLVKRLSNLQNHVIATGGGLIINPENMELLSKNSLLIWLYASLEKIRERVGDNSPRPLLKRDWEQTEALWLKRQPVYRQADLHIDTTDKDLEEVVNSILAELKQNFGNRIPHAQ